MPASLLRRHGEKYLRWALADAGVRVQPDTPPVHVIYCKHQDEDRHGVRRVGPARYPIGSPTLWQLFQRLLLGLRPDVLLQYP
jgi:hypothetical protein